MKEKDISLPFHYPLSMWNEWKIWSNVERRAYMRELELQLAFVEAYARASILHALVEGEGGDFRWLAALPGTLDIVSPPDAP